MPALPQVIVLHGLARTSFSMRHLARALEQAGYCPHNLSYPSRQMEIEALAQHLLPSLKNVLMKDAPLHFVSHSMGGLVGRELMQLLPDYNWASAVFLAPPHQGSQIARHLSSHPWTQSFFHWFYGPAGQQVAQAPPQLPLPICPFGVIAGNQPRAIHNPASWISPHIFPDTERHDGTVLVEETKLDTMVDFLEVPINHTTIMNDPQVHQLILHFFQHQHFPRPNALPPSTATPSTNKETS